MGEYGLYHKQTCAPEGRQKKNMVQIQRSQISGTGFLGVGWGGVSWDSISLRPCNTKFMGIVPYAVNGEVFRGN